MSGNQLIQRLRFLLHDGERASDTGAHFYSDLSLERQLTDSLAAIVKTLILQKPRRAILTTQALVASVAVVPGVTEIPKDFFVLEAGSLSGVYVPAEALAVSEALSDLTIAKLYVSAGIFYGPADRAVYFRSPGTIAPNDVDLPYFPDAVYNAAKYMAARDVLIQQSKGAPHRWAFFQNDFMTQLATLQ